jgi:hypothetical protein
VPATVPADRRLVWHPLSVAAGLLAASVSATGVEALTGTWALTGVAAACWLLIGAAAGYATSGST